MAGHGQQEVCIERKNHVGLVEVVSSIDMASKRHLRGGARAIGIHRFVLMPACGRKLREDLFELRGQRRRGDRLGQDSQAFSFIEPLRFQLRRKRRDERIPRRDAAAFSDGFRSLGIV